MNNKNNNKWITYINFIIYEKYLLYNGILLI